MDVFTGVGVALVTLLDESGRVDTASTVALAADLVDRGMRGVLVAGTTGEAATLTDGERTELIEAARGALPGDIPGIARPGAPTAARAAGPRAAAAAAGLPVLAYHIPGVSAPGIPVSALAGLPISGQKDSSGDPDRLLDEVVHYAGSTYVGSSAVLALAGPLGATGAILALANLEPELCRLAFAGDADAQRGLTDAHLAVRAGGVPELKRLLAVRRRTPPLSRPAWGRTSRRTSLAR